MMKPTIRALVMPLTITTLLLTGCGLSAPTSDDVLNAYKDWASSRQQEGKSVLPLPQTAVVEGCERTPESLVAETNLFRCTIKFGGNDDPKKSSVYLRYGFHGWSICD